MTDAAFATAKFSSGAEAAIVDALRTAGALAASLVAAEGETILGHVAFSPVTIEGRKGRWFGLGPVSVVPDRQRQGIGRALIERGLEEIRRMGAEGCVAVGEPAYYARFGFSCDERLRFAGVPAEYFMRIVFDGRKEATGDVAYHEAFGA